MGVPTVRKLYSVVAVAAVVAIAAGAFGCGSQNQSSGSTSGSPQPKKYKIVVSNNYMGNEWRPQMENVVKYIAGSPKYKNRVDLEIKNVNGTAQAQIASLQTIIRGKPDAILIDAASATALNPTVAQATSQGILVFSFDQCVTAPTAYRLPQDYAAQAHDMVEWLATAIGGKGNILMDTGLPGIPISETFVKVWTSTLKTKYPGIKIVGTFSSQYAPGPELQGVSSLVAQNPKIDGILSGGYQSSDIKALQAAGRPLVPMTGLDVNGNEIACAQNHVKAFFFGAPSWVGGLALEHAVALLDKSESYPMSQSYFDTNFVTNEGNFKFDHVQPVQVLTDGLNYYPNDSPSLITPITYSPWQITPAIALGQ